VARVGEVAGVSLPRHRARALSTQTRGPYSVHPCSAARKRSLFFKLPVGDTPSTSPTPTYTLNLRATRSGYSNHVFIFSDARRFGISSHVNAIGCVAWSLPHTSAQSDVSLGACFTRQCNWSRRIDLLPASMRGSVSMRGIITRERNSQRQREPRSLFTRGATVASIGIGKASFHIDAVAKNSGRWHHNPSLGRRPGRGVRFPAA